MDQSIQWSAALANAWAVLCAALGDRYVFPAFEIGFLGFVLFAAVRDLQWPPKRGRVTASVLRGEQSRQHFHLAYGFSSVLLLQVVNSTTAWEQHKTITSIVDLVALLYLCYLNGWFRNKVVACAAWWQQRWER